MYTKEEAKLVAEMLEVVAAEFNAIAARLVLDPDINNGWEESTYAMGAYGALHSLMVADGSIK